LAPLRSDDGSASFRYGAVLVLTFTLLVFQVATPGADWSRAIALLLEGATLMVVVATSRERRTVRRQRTVLIGAVVLALAIAIAFGALPAVVIWGLGATMLAIVPFALVKGLVKLMRTRGVTLQVVAGALAVYLLTGLIFAAVIGVVAHADGGAYFAQGGDGSQSERVYYSVTSMTTTGYGDFTAAHSGGRAIAVVEMVLGQLYLAMVIGVLVGDVASRRRTG